MSQKATDGFDPNDPFGTWRTIRDANLDAWAKGMTSLVGTEVFSKAIGAQLDTLLATSAPMQKVVQQYMEAYLAQVNMPSRNEVVGLAGRLTGIEMRLDDMQAQLDELLFAVRAMSAAPGAAAVAGTGEAKGAVRRPRKPTEE